MIIKLIAINYVLIFLIGAIIFYSSKKGLNYVHNSLAVWTIDIFSLLSGTYITFICIMLYNQSYNLLLITPLFLGGSSQFLIHITKIIVRVFVLKK